MGGSVGVGLVEVARAHGSHGGDVVRLGRGATADHVDAKVYLDAPVTVPATIKISGVASSRSVGGTTLEKDVVVAAYRSSDEATAVAMATTDATGKYEITITTNGDPLDGFLKATKAGFVTTYLYPTAPIVADFPDAAVNLVTQNTFDTISNLAGGAQMPGKGFIALIVEDATGKPVSGAMIASSPASSAYKFDAKVGQNELPSSTATMTDVDGVGFMFNVPPTGTVQVSATKTGTTFKPHSLTAHADAFTTTLVTP